MYLDFESRYRGLVELQMEQLVEEGVIASVTEYAEYSFWQIIEGMGVQDWEGGYGGLGNFRCTAVEGLRGRLGV